MSENQSMMAVDAVVEFVAEYILVPLWTAIVFLGLWLRNLAARVTKAETKQGIFERYVDKGFEAAERDRTEIKGMLSDHNDTVIEEIRRIADRQDERVDKLQQDLTNVLITDRQNSKG